MTARADPQADYFPVTWRLPEDAQMLWAQDRLHYPDPITPLEFSLIEDGVDAGLTKAAHAYGIPIRVHDRLVNGYLYTTMESLAGEGAAVSGQGPAATMEAAMVNLRARWDESWLPEIQGHLRWWSSFDRAAAGPAELAALLDETRHRWARVWEIHFLLFLPAKLAISEFVDLHSQLFPESDPFAPLRMIAGFPTRTMECGRRLWSLSRHLLASPDALWTFGHYPACEVVAQLRRAGTETPFLAGLDAFLVEYGARADKLSLSYPTWAEDPVPVVDALRQHLQQGNRDLGRELEEASRQREMEVARLRNASVDLPRPVRAEVELRLDAAQAGAYLAEEHGHWIDYGASAQVRQVVLTIGGWLAAVGALADRSDVFYLEMAELEGLLGCAPGRAAPRPSMAGRIAERRAAAQHFADVAPPAFIGAEPVGPAPPPDGWDPIAEMFRRVEGATPAGSDVDLVVGIGGSPGEVVGVVRVLHALNEAGKLQPGDVLVAGTTSPAWTVLFGAVSGLVTDSGGILSHSAVVAREYGIPAVVGAGDATTRLHDGQLVALDGRRGTVRILR